MPLTHAYQRAMQRFPGVCPGVLVKGIRHSVIGNCRDGFAEFWGAVSIRWLIDLYRFQTAAGQTGYAIVNSVDSTVVTLLAEGSTLKVERGVVRLGKDGLEATDES